MLESLQTLSDVVSNVGGFVLSVLGFIWYGFTTIINAIPGLIDRLLDSSLILNIHTTFLKLSAYLGAGPTLFLYAMMFLAVIRIIIHFVLHIGDYGFRRTQKRNREPTDYVEDETNPRIGFPPLT